MLEQVIQISLSCSQNSPLKVSQILCLCSQLCLPCPFRNLGIVHRGFIELPSPKDGVYSFTFSIPWSEGDIFGEGQTLPASVVVTAFGANVTVWESFPLVLFPCYPFPVPR